MALALLHRFSLEGLAEGWTDECHLMYQAVKFAEVKALQELDKAKLDETAAVDHIIAFVQDHVAGGKVLKLAADGTTKLEEITKEEVAELPLDTITKVFQEMNGGKLDPKDTPSAAPSEPQQPTSEAATTTS